MSDEFSYTFKRHSIVLTRDHEDANWYIRVRGPDGLHKYDGYWRDSAGKPLKDALYEAKVGAQLSDTNGAETSDEPQPLSDAQIMELWVQAGGVLPDVNRARKTQAMLRTMVEAWDAYWMGGRQQDAAAHFVAVVQQARALTDAGVPVVQGGNDGR